MLCSPVDNLAFSLDIEFHTTAPRKIGPARQYYVKFTVGNTTKSTKSAKEDKDRTTWSNTFYL